MPNRTTPANDPTSDNNSETNSEEQVPSHTSFETYLDIPEAGEKRRIYFEHLHRHLDRIIDPAVRDVLASQPHFNIGPGKPGLFEQAAAMTEALRNPSRNFEDPNDPICQLGLTSAMRTLLERMANPSTDPRFNRSDPHGGSFGATFGDSDEVLSTPDSTLDPLIEIFARIDRKNTPETRFDPLAGSDSEPECEPVPGPIPGFMSGSMRGYETGPVPGPMPRSAFSSFQQAERDAEPQTERDAEYDVEMQTEPQTEGPRSFPTLREIKNSPLLHDIPYVDINVTNPNFGLYKLMHESGLRNGKEKTSGWDFTPEGECFPDLTPHQTCQAVSICNTLLTTSTITSLHITGGMLRSGSLYQGQYPGFDPGEMTPKENLDEDVVKLVEFLLEMKYSKGYGALSDGMFHSERHSFYRIFTFPPIRNGLIPTLLISVTPGPDRNLDEEDLKSIRAYMNKYIKKRNDSWKINGAPPRPQSTNTTPNFLNPADFESFVPRNEGDAEDPIAKRYRSLNNLRRFHNRMSKFLSGSERFDVPRERRKPAPSNRGSSTRRAEDVFDRRYRAFTDYFTRLLKEGEKDFTNAEIQYAQKLMEEGENSPYAKEGEEEEDDEEEHVLPAQHIPFSFTRTHFEFDDPRVQDNESWISQVTGGYYPPTHPIFSARSLATDHPSERDGNIIDTLLKPRPEVYLDALEKQTQKYCFLGDNSIARDSCPVCMIEYVQDEVLRKLNCGHVYHSECIEAWVGKCHNICPLCRDTCVKRDNIHIF